MARLSQNELEELDMEFFFEREGIAFKVGQGVSGLQANLKYCPACGDARWRTYFGLDSGRGNCLAGDTEILTREYGAVQIELVSGQTVTLLDGDGNWVPCMIHDYGIQETFATKFDGFRGSTIVRSTAKHGWVTTDGSVTKTRELSYKSRIADLRPSKQVCDESSYKLGILHGIIYGDGFDEGGRYRVRLCGDKNVFASIFEEAGLLYTMCGSDRRYRVANANEWASLKNLPVNPGENLDYLLGFIRGWFAMDGCVSEQASGTICVGVTEEQWLRKWGSLVGWHFKDSTKLNGVTNYGPRKKEVFNLRLRTRMMASEDFLLPKHRQRWDSNPHLGMFRHEWVLGKVDADPRMERVYCPYVPTTNSFALACGVHSRNCFRCSQTFNKTSFIHAHFEHGDDEWRLTFEKIEEVLKEQGWMPKRQAMVAVDTSVINLPMSEPISDATPSAKQYLEQRNISEEISTYFNFRYCQFGWWMFNEGEETKMMSFGERIIIPVFDLDGTLKTFQGRDMTGGSDRKYLFPKGLPGTGRYLLNGHNCVASARACMGEGFFDVAAIKMALDEEQDLRDVTALGSFGKHLSYGDMQGNDQLGRFNALRLRGLKSVTIMWDGEPRALEAALDAARKLVSISLEVRIALLPFEKDPNEVTPEVVRSAFRSARLYTPSLDMQWRLANPYSSASLRGKYKVA